MTAVAAPASGRAQVGFRRDVGLVGLTFTSLGSVIGSGWLLGALGAAEAAGPAAIVSYLIAGAIFLVLGLVFAELAAAYPVTGATSRVPHLAFGSLVGFTSGWVTWLGTVTLAPIEVEAALQYLTPKVHFVTLTHESGGSTVLTGTGIVVAVLAMLLFTFINVLGVRKLSDSNTVTVLWKIAIPLITVVALIIVGFHGTNFSSGSGGGFAPYGVHGILAALPAGVVFSLTGFEQAVQIGGESRNPAHDMPRAVVGSLLLGLVLYIALQIAFIGAVSPSAILHGWTSPIGKGTYGPFATLATGLGLSWLAVLLYIDAVISPGGTGLIYIGTSSRVGYSLSRSGYTAKSLLKIDKRGVPFVSIIVSFAIGLLIFLPFPGWQSLVSFISSASALLYSFAPLALTALRRSDPSRERPYLMPAASVLAPLSFAAASLIVYWSGWTVYWKVMVALGIGFLVVVGSQLKDRRITLEEANPRVLLWLVPYLGGMGVLTKLGQFKGGSMTLPFGWDIAVVAALSFAVYAIAGRTGLSRDMIERVLAEETEASSASASA